MVQVSGTYPQGLFNGLLERLLGERCESESRYQELLAEHPWTLGRPYAAVVRHHAFDDSSIPDFTAVRCYDECHDIIELKQPFLQLFKATGDFAAGFNDAWNQAEGYLTFSSRNRSYLLQEKGLRFEDPKCLLICGYNLQ
ncbi:MAG TPA: Shedu anti-phage system protein SduA domain-containing protein, partial [Steroidobacteraceae bacterium]